MAHQPKRPFGLQSYLVVPKRDTVLSPGDRLTVVIEASSQADHEHWLRAIRHGALGDEDPQP